MKNKVILTIGLIGSIYTSEAQCILPPVCTQEVVLTCNDISNQNINGSPCFKGSGTIPTSYNINNANYYDFDGGGPDSTIFCYQNINLQNGPKKVYNENGKFIFYGNMSMDGQDTIVCYNNTQTIISHLIPNNGSNTIVLSGNATIKVGPDANNLVQYYPGDIIHVVPGNSSNDVKVVACTIGIPLAITFLEFKLYHNTLSWKVIGSDNIELQYSEDSKAYKSIEFNLPITSSLDIKEAGFYRLKCGNEYSKTIMYDLKVLTPEKEYKIYYLQGRWYKERPSVNIVGVKYIK